MRVFLLLLALQAPAQAAAAQPAAAGEGAKNYAYGW